MRILLSIDDTDNFTTKGIKGTGDLAKNISRAIKSNGWGASSRITRHQLLLHEDIPYTSHNSSMCFEADIDPQYLQAVIDFSARHLETESEPEADPGLCVVVPDRLADPVRLIGYGYLAKREVLDKNGAYALASELGIHLSEHGGTGQGIIGAMAGAGLRLGGNDGSFKDKHKVGEPGTILTAAELCALAKVDQIKSLDGALLEGKATVVLGNMVKSILSEGKAVIPVQLLETADQAPVWKTCSKEQIHLLQRTGQ
ncbi:hypothetical protein SAMN04487895_110199 [Paenibacillus sophorae]|uniref:tRNA(Ile2) 2-agmatinylcytidine synthetase n=1 Tax=Paenibacillus sophorae TaxID=1333845 RepID=A0A1H8RZN6_9BACL|nr:hypothetical protein [Paenibacillus sophorae]QWU16891.1 hypothetical protein KP014_06730 [Paenibacillus sophorae]SEO72149.1 hypothetical protein SAMN04487895_110199 [Paenibacillus sophorae]